MGNGLVDVIKSRTTGKVSGALNGTFITLIPKKYKLDTFSDYRPIDLYNLVYKLITKIVTNRIKPNLSKYISKQQFGFLDERNILEAIGIAQEGFHSIKVKQLKSLALNIDLIKAYDRVN